MLYDTIPHYRSTPVDSAPIVVYGTQWCGMTQMIRRYLDRSGIPYQYIDLDYNSEARTQLKWLTGGYVSHPTVYINGQILVEPTLNELKWAITSGY